MWEMTKNLNDFKAASNNMRSEGEISRADVIDYLIKRIEKREEQLKEIKNMCYNEQYNNLKNIWILDEISSESEL